MPESNHPEVWKAREIFLIERPLPEHVVATVIARDRRFLLGLVLDGEEVAPLHAMELPEHQVEAASGKRQAGGIAIDRGGGGDVSGVGVGFEPEQEPRGVHFPQRPEIRPFVGAHLEDALDLQISQNRAPRLKPGAPVYIVAIGVGIAEGAAPGIELMAHWRSSTTRFTVAAMYSTSASTSVGNIGIDSVEAAKVSALGNGASAG